MKTGWVLIVLLLFTAAPVQALEEEVRTYTESYIEEQIQEGSFYGASVSIVQDGEVVLSEGYGFADVQSQLEAEAETLFRVGSVGKSMTAAATLQLVEEGALSLDTSVTDMLSITLANEPEETVTIPHLLTHTAGFDETAIEFYTDSLDNVSYTRFLEERTPPLKRKPGTEVEYSNVGLTIAGQLADDASGMSFPEYVDANIFEPLGMEDSSFAQHEDPSRVSASYIGESAHPYSYFHMVPAGSITTTADDMARYMTAHLKRDPSLASENSFTLMHEPQFYMHEDVAGMNFGHYESQFGGVEAVRHDGAIDAFLSSMLLVPELDLGIFISTNSVNGIESQRVIPDFLDGLAEILAPGVEQLERADSPTDQSELDSYTGSFTMNRVSEYGPLSVMQVFNPTIAVEAESDGSLLVEDLYFSGDWKAMQETASPLVFQEEEGYETLALLEEERFVSSVHPMMIFEKVPAVGERTISYVVLGFIAAVSLFFLLVIPVRGLYRMIRRRKVPHKSQRILAFFTVFALLLSAGVLTAAVQLLVYGYMTAGTLMLAVLLLPLVLAFSYALVWRRSDFGRSTLGFILIQTAVLLFTAFVLYWQMTPFHV